ncbi:hypothetical protein HUC45_24715, partial [Escherichia coli]
PGVLVPAGFVDQYREVWPVYLIEHETKLYRYRLALLQEFVRAIENRLLEEQAAQLLPRGDRQVYQSEIANSQRIIENLTE